MIGSIIIIEQGPAPGILKRDHGRLMRESFVHAGEWYHATYMADHFTRAGARKYGYRPRKGEQAGIGTKRYFASYTGRKQKRHGHTRPLVWSGASETLARIRDVRATRNRGRIVQHARGLNRRNPHSNINMAEEVRTVADFEARELVQQFGRHYREQASKIKTRRTRRVN